MLNADDPGTITSLLLLRDAYLTSNRPLVFWVGAGASKWLNQPSWKESALLIRRNFFEKFRPGFNNTLANKLVDREEYPELFQLCKETDQAAYFRFLAETFAPAPITPLYSRLRDCLQKIAPLYIVTTNVDEALEGILSHCSVVQRTDLTRLPTLVQDETPFIAKLHGSVSSVQSLVFSKDDYQQLLADNPTIETIKWLFTSAAVVFLGYGLKDEYVVKLLTQNGKDFSLFGTGPHFVVSNSEIEPESIRRIGYHISLHPDHRAALTVLDYIAQLRGGADMPASSFTEQVLAPPPQPCAVVSDKTAYYISDFTPPGTWQTSQTFTFGDGMEEKGEGSIGLGFTNEEQPFRESTAMHDLCVGLTCFDHVYFAISALGAVHHLVGSELFWELVRSDVVRFIHLVHVPVVIFPPNEIIGDVGVVSITGDPNLHFPTLGEIIHRYVTANPGKEAEAEKLFEMLESKTQVYEAAQAINLPSLIRGALLMPFIAKLLGISSAILPTQAPKWLRFPYLRLGHLVHTAAVCDAFGIQAAKLPFGGTQLTTGAFAVRQAQQYADEFTSYIYSGRFNTDLGVLVMHDVSIIRNILRFRESNTGIGFRAEVHDALMLGTGTEFTAAVDAGLHRSVPPRILEKAYDQLSALMTKNARQSAVPAVWTDVRHSDDVTRLWRRRSLRQLEEICKSRGVGKDAPCLCGSGEKLRVCCMLPLKQ